MKLFLSRLCIMVLLALLGYFRTDAFNQASIEPAFQKFELTDFSPADEIKNILKQKFSYLGRGRQCFAFQSEDGKYVLKLFNHNSLHYPYLIERFLDYVKKKKNEKQKIRRQWFFNSYKLSFEELKDETGLVFVHFNQTSNLNLKTTLFSKSHQKYDIDMDVVAFALQKKAVPILQVFKELKKKEDFERAIDSLVRVIRTHCLKNIINDDLNVANNFGFIGNRAVIFDCGRFLKSENLVMEKEMHKSTKFFRRWLIENHPDEVLYLDRALLYPSQSKNLGFTCPKHPHL